ncbi:MAG: AbiV family abortive infection protein [Candidatus Hodarchaeales archaeon]|jgi:AbiV family abortive infection protein
MVNPSLEITKLLEMTIFSFNNVQCFIKDVQILVEKESYGHALALSIFGIEEWINAMNYHGNALGIISNDELKKIQRNKKFLSQLERVLEQSIETVFVNWIQKKREAFQMLINYIQSETDEDGNAHLAALAMYLQHDDSQEASIFNKLITLKGNKEFSTSILEKKKYSGLFVTKSFNPLVIEKKEVEEIESFLGIINEFIDSFKNFLKEEFLNPEIFQKYKKLSDNTRQYWSDVSSAISSQSA